MIRQYRKLLGLTLSHSYYLDGLCPDFSFVPTLACKQKLAQFGLVFKSTENGFRLIYRAMESGGNYLPAISLAEMPAGERLSFQMQLKNPEFLNFTELGGGFTSLSKSIVLFSSEGGTLTQDTGVPDTLEFPAFRILTIRPQDFSYRFTMPGNPATARLLVVNAQGKTVRSLEIQKDSGDNYTANLSLSATEPGVYTFRRVDPGGALISPDEELYLDQDLYLKAPFGILEMVNESDGSGSYWDQVQVFNQNPANERELECGINFDHKTGQWQYTVVFKRTAYSGDPADYEIRDGLTTVIDGDRYNTGQVADQFFFSTPPSATTFDGMDALIYLSRDDQGQNKDYPWYEESKHDLLLAEVDNPGGAIVKRLIRELSTPDPSFCKPEIIVFI